MKKPALAAVLLLAVIARVVALPPLPAGAQEPALSGPPVRLVIPALDVDADVGWFDLAEDSTMPVPQRAALVAWYNYSAPAGATGNVVLAGHRDWQRERGVFYSLDRLAVDDDIWVEDAAETWYLYTVTWTAAFATDDAPLFDIAGYAASPLLTMITCGGTFDRDAGRYVERRIVRAELVLVLPAGDE